MSRRVLVTAGASGIGREIVKEFVATGAKVFICDIDQDAIDVLSRELAGVGTMRCDVSKRDQNESMVEAALQWLGGIDVLVNNAGIAGPMVPVEEFPPEEWDRVVQVNLTAAFDITRRSIPALKASPAGVVIVISSAAGRFGYPNRIAYAATKWGLIGFTKTLAMELGAFGIRCNAILPGAVEGKRVESVIEKQANLQGRSIDEVRAESMRNQSLKRRVDPKDIAALAVFLSSSAGRSISGQALAIDNDIQRL
ncbi:MAG: D-beta-hydroxybutyrate dehydrogenase [Pseudomonadales bacterium]|nr:D-beta-hydroxybutyrate dehydrogenase [Pseudomonadales bacterium]